MIEEVADVAVAAEEDAITTMEEAEVAMDEAEAVVAQTFGQVTELQSLMLVATRPNAGALFRTETGKLYNRLELD